LHLDFRRDLTPANDKCPKANARPSFSAESKISSSSLSLSIDYHNYHNDNRFWLDRLALTGALVFLGVEAGYEVLSAI